MNLPLTMVVLLVLATPLSSYRLYTSLGVSSLPPQSQAQDMLSLLQFNMGQYPLEVSPEQQVLFNKQPSPLPTSSLLITLNPTTHSLPSSIMSCTLSQQVKSVITVLDNQQQNKVEFDLCRIQRMVEANTNSQKIQSIACHFLSSLYKDQPKIVISILDAFLVPYVKNNVQFLINTNEQLSAFRMLETETEIESTGELVIDSTNFQIYVWFPVVLAFVLFFAVMAMFQLDFSNDTILYAKFLTADKQ